MMKWCQNYFKVYFIIPLKKMEKMKKMKIMAVGMDWKEFDGYMFTSRKVDGVYEANLLDQLSLSQHLETVKDFKENPSSGAIAVAILDSKYIRFSNPDDFSPLVSRYLEELKKLSKRWGIFLHSLSAGMQFTNDCPTHPFCHLVYNYCWRYIASSILQKMYFGIAAGVVLKNHWCDY
ncbi:hypothetical protein BDC45DRAFT_328499 [Circinella umbellata]|nr:hypothetical protein BDC45DRAFT_328499 [Circinella umbellata]